MKELNPTIDNLNAAALDAAFRSALPGKVFGVSSYGSSRPVSIWLDDAATPSDETTALALAAGHDPVFVASIRRRFRPTARTQRRSAWPRRDQDQHPYRCSLAEPPFRCR
jgi:hypothetical protein